jgi:hypothetical protein
VASPEGPVAGVWKSCVGLCGLEKLVKKRR